MDLTFEAGAPGSRVRASCSRLMEGHRRVQVKKEGGQVPRLALGPVQQIFRSLASAGLGYVAQEEAGWERRGEAHGRAGVAGLAGETEHTPHWGGPTF